MTTSQQNIGICADHGGFKLKEKIKKFLLEKNYKVTDFGAEEWVKTDDYPDYVIPLAQGIAAKQIYRGIAICGSGVGACVAANKVKGARAALITDHFSAHQGVEDDDMNMICLGGRVIGEATAEELVLTFLKARFIGAERHIRRLKKIEELEERQKNTWNL